jgi:hypothetical protein
VKVLITASVYKLSFCTDGNAQELIVVMVVNVVSALELCISNESVI